MAMDIDTALHELVLTRPVTENDIVHAYRRMAIRFHPDKATDPDEKRWAQQKFVQVQEAYELLKGLPIDTINASPDRKASQEMTGGSEKQPRTVKTCPFCTQQIQYEAIKCRFCGRFLDPLRTQQPSHEGPHPSHSSAWWTGRVGFLCCVVVLVVFLLILDADVSRPQRLSGSPTAQTTADQEMIALVRRARMQDDEKEFLQTFGRLLRIGRGLRGYFAHFERINHRVYNGQVIHGFEVHVLSNEVTFTKNGRGWTWQLSQ